YKNPKTDEFEQLIYKRFQKNRQAPIEENVQFKMQIFNDLKCNSISVEEVSKIKYTKNSLVDIFKKINNCNESSVQVYENTNFKKAKFGLSIYGGAHLTSYSVNSLATTSSSYDTKKDVGFSPVLGLELSLKMPSNKLD